MGAAVTAVSKKATDAAVDYAKSVTRLSRETGIAEDQMSRLVFAFQRSGLDASEASSVLGIFSKKIAEANEKTGEAALKQAELQNKMQAANIQIRQLTEEKRKSGDASGELSNKIEKLNIDLRQYQAELKEAAGPLQALGVQTKNADGTTRQFDQILLEVADKFQQMPNGAEKTAAAMELFGRSGKELIPILNQGSRGITELMKRADELGITLTPENMAKVKAYIEAQKELKDSTQALTMTVGFQAIPMWQKLTEATNTALGALITAPSPIKEVVTGFLAFGGPAMTAAGAVLTFGANIANLENSAVLGKVAGSLSAVGGAFKLLGTFLLGPWGIALAAVVVGLVLLSQQFGGLRGMLEAFMPWLTKIWEGFAALLQPAIENLKQAWSDLKVAIEPFIPLLKEAGKAIGILLVLGLGALIVTLALVVAAIANVIGWIARLVGWLSKTLKEAFDSPAEAARSMAGIIIGVLAGLPARALEAGLGLVRAFADGIGRMINVPADKVREMVDRVRRLLPFSDAKEGPLSNLTLSGRRFSETFAAGIRSGAGVVATAVRDVLPVPAGTPGLLTSPSSAAAGAVTQHNTFNVYNQVNPLLIAKELGWAISRA